MYKISHKCNMASEITKNISNLKTKRLIKVIYMYKIYHKCNMASEITKKHRKCVSTHQDHSGAKGQIDQRITSQIDGIET